MGEWIGESRMRYGHSFDSQLLNGELRQLYDELKDSYGRIASLEASLSDERDTHEHELRALSGQLKALEEAMTSLESRIGQTLGSRTVFVREATPKGDDPLEAMLHIEEGVVMCKPRRRIDKLTMSNETGDRFLPSIVSVKVGRTNNGGQVEDTGERKVLTGEGVWRRQVVYDTVSAPKREDAIYEVSLPLLFSGDRLVNEVVIHPFPNATVEVASVQVQTAGEWKSIEWSRPPQSPAATRGPIRLSFKATPATALRVQLVQETRRDRGSKSTFVLGLEALEVMHAVQQGEEQFFLASTSMSGTYGVSRIEPIFQHPVAARQYRTELYRERDGVLLPIEPTAWHSLSEGKLWVKVWLRPDVSTGVSPSLQAVRIHTREIT